jgi:hypothetical protein
VATTSSSSVRQLKWLIVILLISNIAIGLCSVYALRRADQRYSALIDRTLPVLNDLQTLTASATKAMVATNVARAALGDVSAFVRQSRGVLQQDSAVRQRVSAKKWLIENNPDRLKMQSLGEAFTNQAMHVLDLLADGNTTEAVRFRETTLRHSFDQYIDSITAASDVLEAESEKASDAETARTNAASKMVLALAGWPFIAGSVLVLITTVTVVVLMILFRRNGPRHLTDGMPELKETELREQR